MNNINTNINIDQSTINKITALMNLKDHRGATENETANASAHVMRLLAKYNLDMAEFDKIANPVEDIDQEFMDNEKQSMPRWKTNLLSAIAKAHFCAIYLSHGYRKTSHVIVGKPTNVNAVKIVYGFLSDVVETEAQEALRHYTGFEHGKKYLNAFRLGMVSRIAERLKQEMNLIQEDHVKALGNPGKEIVVKNIYEEARIEIQKYYATTGIKLRASTYSGVIGSGAGFNKGYEAGRGVPLHSSPSLKQRN